MPSPDLHAERAAHVLRVADRVGDAQVAAPLVEQVDRERVERRQPRDELRDLLEQLVEVEDGRDFPTELEERQQQGGRFLGRRGLAGRSGGSEGEKVRSLGSGGCPGLYLRAFDGPCGRPWAAPGLRDQQLQSPCRHRRARCRGPGAGPALCAWPWRRRRGRPAAPREPRCGRATAWWRRPSAEATRAGLEVLEAGRQRRRRRRRRRLRARRHPPVGRQPRRRRLHGHPPRGRTRDDHRLPRDGAGPRHA